MPPVTTQMQNIFFSHNKQYQCDSKRNLQLNTNAHKTQFAEMKETREIKNEIKSGISIAMNKHN
jgi:hypothetical protein